MAKDASRLKEEAAEANAAGRYKRALAAYLELERLEPRDAQWSKRAGETYRKLGNNKHAIEAFTRSADRYAQNGFLVQAIAVCKMVLQIDPQHADALRRLAQMNELVGMGPTRAAGFAENNPALHENPNVAAIRRASTMGGMYRIPNTAELETQRTQQIPIGNLPKAAPSVAPPSIAMPRTKTATPPIAMPRTKTSTPPVAMPRTKSKPISLPPGAGIDAVQLSKEVPEASLREASTPGIHVIPLEDTYELQGIEDDPPSGPIIEIEPPDHSPIEPELDELSVLELADIEEIPLPEPRAIGAAAAQALASTPLFAGLPSDTLEALVEHLALVSLDVGEVLFREGDPGDALYVVVEGELAVQAEGPPRVEMQRLGPGSFIGEVALMTDQPRAATVTGRAPSELLRIDRGTLSRVLANHGDVLRAVLRFVRDRLVDRWMRTSPLFRPFDDTERAELADRFTFLEIDSGTKLLDANTRPDGLYIVLAGQFDVQRAGAVVARLGPGDLIGETALLSGGVFKSDVMAKGKGLALCLPAAEFREVIMTHPHVLEYIGEQAEHSRRLQIL